MKSSSKINFLAVRLLFCTSHFWVIFTCLLISYQFQLAVGWWCNEPGGSYSIWNLECWSCPQEHQDTDFQQDIFSFSLLSSFWFWLTIKIWRPQLLWYLSLCGLFFSSSSFTYLTFFSVIGSSSACSTFGINFSSRACRVVSWQPYRTHQSCQLWILTWCSKFLREPRDCYFLLMLLLSLLCFLCVLTQYNTIPCLNLFLFPISGSSL